MTSILTNTAAMSALQSLSATQRQLSMTQAQVSSGLAVANASDNAAYWSIGQTMSAQVSGMAAAQEAEDLVGSIAAVTKAALTQVLAALNGMKGDFVTAREAGVNLSQLQSDIAARQANIRTVAASATFNGQNWLIGSASISTTINIEDSYDSDYATWLSENNHTAPMSLVVNDSITYDAVATKVDGHGNASSQTVNASLSRVLYDQTYGSQSTLSRTAIGAIEPDEERYVTGVSASGTQYGFIPVGDFELFTSGPSTRTVNHITTWTDGTTISDNNDLPPWFSHAGLPSAATGGILDQSVTMGGTSSTLLDLSLSEASSQDLIGGSNAVQNAIDGVTSALASLGGVETWIANQQTFNASLSDALTSGIGSLVDADMNVASTRLQALQTQQQLGIQALSIANQNSQLVLKLFQAA